MVAVWVAVWWVVATTGLTGTLKRSHPVDDLKAASLVSAKAFYGLRDETDRWCTPLFAVMLQHAVMGKLVWPTLISGFNVFMSQIKGMGRHSIAAWTQHPHFAGSHSMKNMMAIMAIMAMVHFHSFDDPSLALFKKHRSHWQLLETQTSFEVALCRRWISLSHMGGSWSSGTPNHEC